MNMQKQPRAPDSFYNLFAVARMMGIPKATVENFNPNNSPSALSPIAHLFICFEEDGRKTWAIRKKYYEKWKATGIAPKKNGRPNKNYEGPKPKHINIPAPDFYDAFVAGVEKCNRKSFQQITIQSTIHIAMKEFMERRPEIFYGVDDNGKQE